MMKKYLSLFAFIILVANISFAAEDFKGDLDPVEIVDGGFDSLISMDAFCAPDEVITPLMKVDPRSKSPGVYEPPLFISIKEKVRIRDKIWMLK